MNSNEPDYGYFEYWATVHADMLERGWILDDRGTMLIERTGQRLYRWRVRHIGEGMDTETRHLTRLGARLSRRLRTERPTPGAGPERSHNAA